MTLTLDESTHQYSLDGRRLIGVTEALKILDDRWKIDPWYLERGRLIHLATEYYDRDELDESTIDERIRPYLDAYVKFRKNTDFEPIYIEQLLYHPQYFYAGKPDRIGPLYKHHVLIDLKSGAKSKIDELQDVAYWELCRVNDIPVNKLFDLYLKENGTYKLEPVERPRNLLPVFLACVTAVRWKEGI